MLKPLVPAVLVIVLQTVDIQEAGLLMHARIAFGLAQVFCLGICLYIWLCIATAKVTGEKVHVPAVVQFGQEVQTAATMSVPEYDQAKLGEQLKHLLVGGAISFGIHWKWGYVTPICMQVLMTPMNLLGSPLAKVYLFKKVARGDLLRPWPLPNPFGFPGASSPAKTAKERRQEAKKAKK